MTRADDSPAPRARTTRQWVALGAVVALVAAGCVLAGRWQWNRHVARDHVIQTIERNYDSAPVPVGDLLPVAGSATAEDDVWRPVTLRGRYLDEATVLLRNRPVSGPAFQVLVPFQDEDGGVLVVNRGWVPLGRDASTAAAVPAAPAGPVEITVRLRAEEAASGRDAPDGQVQAINVGQVLAAGGLDPAASSGTAAYRAYGVLAGERATTGKDVTGPRPAALPRPDLDPGSHLSYAYQWWIFALGAVAGFVVLLRRERAEARDAEPSGATAGAATGSDPASAESGASRDSTSGAAGRPVAADGPRGPGRRAALGRAGGGSRPGRRAHPTAEEEEDALVQAQLDRLR